MTVTRLAAVGGMGARDRRTSWGGVRPLPCPTWPTAALPQAATVAPPATECGRR